MIMTLSNLWDLLVSPFADFAFMRRALAACLILAIGGTPLGVFMSLRRVTLAGDALSHAILPGVAVAFAVCGLSVWPLTLGGLVCGVLVALLAAGLSRATQLKEDASFTLIYLVCLAAGVVIISAKGNSLDLMHLLFGDILAIDAEALGLMAGAACLSVLVLAGFYRTFVIGCFDPAFAEATMKTGRIVAPLFFALLVVNLVAAFQALGTLMALGLMILPALAARFWTQDIDRLLPLAVLFGVIAAPSGLLISYYLKVPSGPAIVLTAGALCFASLLVGRFGSVRTYLR